LGDDLKLGEWVSQTEPVYFLETLSVKTLMKEKCFFYTGYTILQFIYMNILIIKKINFYINKKK